RPDVPERTDNNMNNNTTKSGLTFDIQLSDRRKTPQERQTLLENPGFGQVFTDHMVTIRYTEGRGWHDAKLEPYGPLSLDPATAALHYAQEILEGLKAYRHPDEALVSFRAEANAARFTGCAARIAIVELPGVLFLRYFGLILDHDGVWVPDKADFSLYLRPFLFVTDVGLGVNNPSRTYLYLLLASPVGSYLSGGIQPVTVWLSTDYTRASPGGTGEAKFAGNYAASFLAQA